METLDGRTVDDDTAAELAVLATHGLAEALPDDPPYPTEEMLAELRHGPADVDQRLWLEREGADLVGAAFLEVENRITNRHIAFAWVDVHPDHRRRGLGSRLLEAAMGEATGLGRTMVLSFAAPGTSGEAFLLAQGAEPVLAEDLNRLAVAEVDPALLGAWSVPVPGYSLVEVDDPCPDALLRAFADLMAVMNDAPMAEGVEDIVVTPEEVRLKEASRAAAGKSRLALVARHDETGELAGLTEFFLSRARPWLAHQGDTGVRREHRRHGLGRWLKAANLQRLLATFPAVTTVETENATDNEAMLAINLALGFRPATTWIEHRLPSPVIMEA